MDNTKILLVEDDEAVALGIEYNLKDEPTGNLDKENSKEVMELLKLSSKKYKQTLVVVTHDLEIASAADRIITLSDGKIIS